MGCSAATARMEYLQRDASKQQVVHKQYAFLDKIGQGSFGQVRTCIHRKTGCERAVKMIYVDANDGSCREEAEREGELWAKAAGHRNIVQLCETFSDDTFVYYVMEKCDRSLCDMLLKTPGVQETDLLQTFRQMLLGLEHCHSMGVVHRDVKPANFLVTTDDIVKLCDFGLAAAECTHGITGIVGSAPYMSPEMVQRKRYNNRTDIWSLGATIHMMLYGRYVYTIKDEDIPKSEKRARMHRAIATGSQTLTLVADEGLPEPSALAREFVQAVLQRDPQKRCSATECLRMQAMMPHKDDSWKQTSSTPSCLAATLKLVKQATAEFEAKVVDPTVVKSMDELIAQLQQGYGGSHNFAQSFSLPIVGEKSLGSTANRFSRTMSHHGELSTQGRGLDSISECSTTTSSRDPPEEHAKPEYTATSQELSYRAECRKMLSNTSSVSGFESSAWRLAQAL